MQTLGLSNGPILVVSVPSPAMVWYAMAYALAALAIAQRVFAKRDL